MKRETLIAIIVFACISLCVTRWFNGWYYIYQTDSLFYLNPEKRLHDVLYFWRDSYSLGHAAPGFNLIPFYSFQTMLYRLFNLIVNDVWKSLILSEFTMYYMIVFLSMFSAFIFFRELYSLVFKRSEGLDSVENLMLLLLSIFYAINIHTIIFVFWRFLTWALFWPSLPLFSYFYLKTISSREMQLQVLNTLLASLIFLTPLGAGFSQAGFVMLILALFIMSVFIGIILGDIAGILRRFCMFVLMLSLFSAWFILPQFLHISVTYTFASATALSSKEQLEYASRSTSIPNVIRFIGYYVFHNTYGNLSYPYSWATEFNHTVKPLTLIYPIVFAASISAAYAEKEPRIRRAFLFIALLELAMVIIMKGAARPFPQIGYMLLKLNDVFFRHPYDRFIHVFFFYYCVLTLAVIRKAVSEVHYVRGVKKPHLYLVVIAFVANLIVSYPFLTGEIIHPLDKIDLRGTDYLRLREILEHVCSDEYCRTLVVPVSVYGEYSYNLSGRLVHVNLKSLVYNFIPENVGLVQFGYSPLEKQLISYLVNVCTRGEYRDFLAVMRVIGVKYIILHKDYTSEYVLKPMYIGCNASFIGVLEKASVVRKVWEGNNIIVYKLSTNTKQVIYPVNSGVVYTLFGKIYGKWEDPILVINPYTLAHRYESSHIIADIKSPLGVAFELKSSERVDYEFSVPHDGYYDVIIVGNGKLNISIDDTYIFIVDTLRNNSIRLYLTKGRHIMHISAIPTRVSLATKSLKDWKDSGFKANMTTTHTLHQTHLDIYEGVAQARASVIPRFYNDASAALYFIIIEPSNLAGLHSNTTINWNRINPTLWFIHATTNKPFMLILAETYDRHWKAKIYKNGKLVEVVHPKPVYGVLNGFWINATGELTIIIEYEPQATFETGLLVSISSAIIAVVYLTVARIRRYSALAVRLR